MMAIVPQRSPPWTRNWPIDVVSIDYIENLFVNLTSRDPETLELVPEAAESWQVSDDGLVYTFKLRTDIPWVHHDPDTGETEQVLDEAGNPRFVTAHDFAYAIKRACDPNLGSYYSTVVAPLIKGCEAVLYADDPGRMSRRSWWRPSGSARRRTTRWSSSWRFRPATLLSMTPMWTLAATPQWAIEEHGEAWIEPGKHGQQRPLRAARVAARGPQQPVAQPAAAPGPARQRQYRAGGDQRGARLVHRLCPVARQ